MKLGDLLLLVVGPLTRRGGASGCVHGKSGCRHGRCSAGFPLLPTAEKKEDGGGGRGLREEVAGFVSGAEVRGRQWWWVRKGMANGRRRGIRRVWVWIWASARYAYICLRGSIVVARFYSPRYYYGNVPGGHSRDHLVVARVINPRYYYQLSSSEG